MDTASHTYDIVIVGGGPAGLTAGLYARRANRSVLILEKATFGGQITFSPKVENIPGFSVLSGNEFAERLVDQVLALGAETESAEVLGMEPADGGWLLHTDVGDFSGRTVILATGARHRRLGLDREESFIGNGISFCAVCDGAFYAGRTVAVIGGGNSALQEALLLSDVAGHVYVVQNLDFLTGEPALQDQLRARENITLLTGRVVTELLGDGELTGIRIRTADGSRSQEQEQELTLDGLFVAIGLVPQNQAFADTVRLDAGGYVDADEHCTAHERGIFVAGDCRRKQIRQVTTAAADGAVAALAACEYLKKL